MSMLHIFITTEPLWPIGVSSFTVAGHAGVHVRKSAARTIRFNVCDTGTTRSSPVGSGKIKTFIILTERKIKIIKLTIWFLVLISH